MSDNQKRFSELYLKENGVFTAEMNLLFSEILTTEFDDNPRLMDEFIQSISRESTEDSASGIEELRRENKELKEWKELIDPKMDAIMEALSKLTEEELI
ncbi:hypothetical protein [Enterococcus casseliflavus]|uniref:hypothetical protein n=1 Tax=Enterococcus casseliflavus TaxID=37734 RepID=UPI0035CA47E9